MDGYSPEFFRQVEQMLADLPKIVWEAREAQDWSQRDLAVELDFSNSTISRVERGLSYDRETLRRLVGWLGREDRGALVDDVARAWVRRGA